PPKLNEVTLVGTPWNTVPEPIEFPLVLCADAGIRPARTSTADSVNEFEARILPPYLIRTMHCPGGCGICLILRFGGGNQWAIFHSQIKLLRAFALRRPAKMAETMPPAFVSIMSAAIPATNTNRKTTAARL